MSVIADFTVGADAFVLAETLRATPTMTVEFERIVAHNREFVLPFIWVTGSEFEQFDHAITKDPTVESASVTDTFPETRLYKMQWVGDIVQTFDKLFDMEGTLLQAIGQDEEWELRVRFDDRTHLITFQEHLSGRGQVHLDQIYSPEEPQSREYELTEKQTEALLAAFEAGFYENPRLVTATELAGRFGLSQQAFSARLRRGVASLIENTIAR